MRRPSGDKGQDYTPGIALTRNPGVALVWITRSFEPFFDEHGGALLRVGDPIRVEAFAEGRIAMNEELEHSIATGLPSILKIAQEDGPEAVAELRLMTAIARGILRLPVEAPA
jgi:hypothetical protein